MAFASDIYKERILDMTKVEYLESFVSLLNEMKELLTDPFSSKTACAFKVEHAKNQAMYAIELIKHNETETIK